MKATGFLLVLAPLVLCTGTAARHEDSEGGFCGVESVETETLNLQSVIYSCFGDSFGRAVPNINFCDAGGRINCPAIKKVLEIIPSCNYCDNTAGDTAKCYIQQKTHTQCSINHFINKLKCVKEFGKCKHKILSHDGFHEVTTIEPTTIDSQEEISTPVSEFAKYGYDRDKGKPDRRHDHDCAPCDCSQSEKKAGVSVGVAVGLLFLGVVIGAIVTAVICICVPSLHSRTSILGGKMRKGFKKSTSREDKYQAQENIDPSVTDNTLPVETTINYPVVPSAPAAPAASNQTRYHTLGGMSNNRDSHMYSGLQPESPEYFEPIGDSDKYQSPENQPMKGPKTVMSPVYQEFTDNVISSAGNNHSKHSANNDNQNSVSQNQPIRSTDTNADATNHNYFVLEPQNKANNSNLPANERPVSDHQYFVLEEQKGQQASDYSEIPSETDKNYHDYFVLEKEQKE